MGTVTTIQSDPGVRKRLESLRNRCRKRGLLVTQRTPGLLYDMQDKATKAIILEGRSIPELENWLGPKGWVMNQSKRWRKG